MDSLKRGLKTALIAFMAAGHLSTAAFAQYAPEAMLAEERNAAFYYKKAFEQIQLPHFSGKQQDLVYRVLTQGWENDQELKEIAELLEKNQPAFEWLEKGIKETVCSFEQPAERYSLIKKSSIPIVELKNLFDLYLLQARVYQKQEQYQQALHICYSALTLAGQIAQEPSLIAKSLSMGMEQRSYLILKDIFSMEKLDAVNKQEAKAFLNGYKQRHFKAQQMVENEQDYFVAFSNVILDGLQHFQTKSDTDPARYSKKEIMVREIRAYARIIAEYYYGNFIRAAESNRDTDWELAMTEMENLNNEIQPNIVKDAVEIGVLVYDTFTGRMEEFNKNVAERIVKLMLAISFPNFRKITKQYYSAMAELDDLETSLG